MQANCVPRPTRTYFSTHHAHAVFWLTLLLPCSLRSVATVCRSCLAVLYSTTVLSFTYVSSTSVDFFLCLAQGPSLTTPKTGVLSGALVGPSSFPYSHRHQCARAAATVRRRACGRSRGPLLPPVRHSVDGQRGGGRRSPARCFMFRPTTRWQTESTCILAEGFHTFLWSLAPVLPMPACCLCFIAVGAGWRVYHCPFFVFVPSLLFV